ncbi:MAG TPA: ABC transporter ATP-binding protein [Kiloniellales bacterium]|nr:ABC transporter ATP-binding protein [Kiloniellales bacterium]
MNDAKAKTGGAAPPSSGGRALPGRGAAPSAEAAMPELPLRRILVWSGRVIAMTPGRFTASLVIALLSQQLLFYASQLLVTALALLAPKPAGPAMSASAPGTAAAADTSGGCAVGQGGEAGLGFLSFMLPTDLTTAAVLFAVISLLVLVLQFAENSINVWCDSAMVARLQQRLHDRLLELGPGFHQKVGIAQTQQIATIYLRTTQTMLRHIVSYPILYGVGFVTATIYLFNNLTIVTQCDLGVLPFIILAAIVTLPIVSWWLAGRLRRAFRAVTTEEQELAVAFANSAARPLEIQLLDAARQRAAAFAREVGDVVRARLRAALNNEVANQVQAATPRVLQIAVLIYGVFQAIKLEGTPAQGVAAAAIVGLIQFAPQAVAPIQQLIQFFLLVNNARPQLDLTLGVLEAEPEIREPARPKSVAPTANDLAFDSVTLRLKAAGPPVLDQLGDAFAPGKVTAIVGRSGSGKSTLLTAAARLRDPDGGRILLSGIDLREMALKDLRRHVAMLSQFPLFMDASVRDNLRLGREDADDATLEQVCRAVGVWPALEANAKGGTALDGTIHMEANKGALSGGERRLLAFARLLLADAPVILLDEPTTGVDAITQKRLIELVGQRLAGRTVLLVDHDMDFVATVAQRICCLENGKVVDVLEKAEFFARPSLFRELHEARRRAIGAGLEITTPPKGSAMSAAGPGPQTPTLMGLASGGPGKRKTPLG